jgi:hypothetical protein
MYQMKSMRCDFWRHQRPGRGYFPTSADRRFHGDQTSTPADRHDLELEKSFSRKDSPMTQAIRQASNTLVIAARLYKELAVSASDLLRSDSYRS